MHEGPLAVGFFDLVLGGGLADPQHFVEIFPLALLQLQLCSLQHMLVIWRNNTGVCGTKLASWSIS